MDGDAELAEPARLMGEPARAAMLTALSGGRALPASDLARAARVTPATASSHLARLLAGGLVVAHRQGRHRYFALASPDVARAVEALQAIAPRRPIGSYRESRAAARLAEARSCYDHLAGRLALDIADALVAEGSLAPLVAGGVGTLHGVRGPVAARLRLGDAEPGSRRSLVRGCLDWTERRPHLAGALGAHVLELLLTEGAVTRVDGDRSLRVDATRLAWLDAA
ncbi:transcriptional regulator, ArsR family [Beutenbergia cavernae DSM 12333]|uniref:Transcriptional regulator, ArsR family n=1 Tax=Beutenbergia cavernae (strain ATCC BAA-8 / DSM 12333 / CCUG 43141 / JCM 11478 / NBRC 16432 / NCIMB 13614 / HKI 0122) TaxID=471853 RepID=C5C5T6_BEUC1|nr:helix-turn-helix transcriptional regulator [Beutenbergia cavernae]ACQ80277.1 transcriptional regulator, ArsR family [Beutenbergia cavernae DSM 12333]